jgi:outer membrane protein assembly factor BamB
VVSTDPDMAGRARAFAQSAAFIQGGLLVDRPDEAPVGDLRGQTPRELRGKRAKYREVLSAVDTATGKIVWQHQLHDHYIPQHRGPHSTPSVEGRHVYAYGGLGVLACVYADTGEEVWRRDLPAELDTKVKKYGTTGSPTVYADRVIVIAWRGRAGVGVYAFDKRTGQDAWQRLYDIGGQCPHSSPVLGEVDGRMTVICHLGEAVVGLDPTSGQPLWKLDYMQALPDCAGGRCYSSESWPVVLDDGLIVDRLWNDIPGPGENRAAGSRGRVVAFRVEDGKPRVIWENTDVSPYYLGIQPWGGSLNFFDNKHDSKSYQWDRGNLTCLEASTGKTLWQSRHWALPARDEARSYRRGPCITLTVADGKMLINDGIHIVLGRCSPERFERLDAFVADHTPWASPVISNGRLYLRAGTELLCYDLRP